MEGHKCRIMDTLLEKKLQAKGAVLIEGPKWCGKTTTAEEIAASKIMLSPHILLSYFHLKDTCHIFHHVLLSGSFNALCDYRPTLSSRNVRGQRLALEGRRPCTGGPHLRASLLAFLQKTRVLRRSGVIDRSPSVAFEERHRGRHRFIHYLLP